ncbi:MAG: hypothetical protein V4586_08785 [Pseudomonadota bacterium]
MLRKSAIVLLMSGLAACGSTNTDGSVASGPLGQTPLMTPAVQVAAQQGLEACINTLTLGAPLSNLAAYNFAPSRNGYRLKIDNPLIFAGDSAVAVKFDGTECSVTAGPIYPVEIQTMQTITANALSGRGNNLQVSFRRSSENVVAILR